MRRKTLSVNASAVLFSTILLAKLTVELVNKKKKVGEVYLELACTIGILLLCLVATVLLIREKKEYKEMEDSDSNLGLNDSGGNIEEIEERQSLLKRSASCPEQLNDDTVPVKEIKKAVKSKIVKENESKVDSYYNLTNQRLSVENFGQDESIIAVTLPESYSIKKYKKIDANREEVIQNTKDGIIDDGDSYKPVNFNVNKIKIVNKGKNKDSYQFTFKFQSTQKDDVYIEINCETLNVYSGWKENKEKPVNQYFKDLKANDDFLIFIDVKQIFSGLLGKVLTFAQKIFPANDQGLSFVAGKDAYGHFKLSLLQEQSSCYIGAKGKGVLGLLNKKFPIKNILINNQLISKKQETKQEHQNDVGQDMQVDGHTNKNVTVGEGISNTSQPQNEHSEVLVSPSPSTSSGVVGDVTSTNDITTVGSKEKSAQKQSVSRSNSKNSLRSQEPIESAGKSKKKFKEKVKDLPNEIRNEAKKIGNEVVGKIKNIFTKNRSKEGEEKLIENNERQEESEETLPSSSVSASSVENAGGIDNPGFVQD